MSLDGLYIYCLAKGDQEESLNMNGIAGIPVQTLSYQGFLVVAQECQAKLFSAEDQKVLAENLLIYQNIVDQAWEKYGTIIPFGFGMIIVPTDGKSGRQNLNQWLEKESAKLEGKLENLKNKAEYGISVLWDPTVIIPSLKKKDLEIQNLEKEILSKPTGTAYLMQKKLEELIRQQLIAAADAHFKDFYQQIRECVDNIQVDKIKKTEPPKQMIINVSCLLNRDKTEVLGAVLEKINQRHGFEVRFSGPWPPYSFTRI